MLFRYGRKLPEFGLVAHQLGVYFQVGPELRVIFVSMHPVLVFLVLAQDILDVVMEIDHVLVRFKM